MTNCSGTLSMKRFWVAVGVMVGLLFLLSLTGQAKAISLEPKRQSPVLMLKR